jgi:hypothetical protein
MSVTDLPMLMPGQLLARGVCRHLATHGFATLEEFTPERGKRLDVMAMGPKGEFWIVECKSSRVDFTSDGKWGGYLEWARPVFLGGGRGVSGGAVAGGYGPHHRRRL